jgi:hypothetical protein
MLCNFKKFHITITTMEPEFKKYIISKGVNEALVDKLEVNQILTFNEQYLKEKALSPIVPAGKFTFQSHFSPAINF